MRLLGGICDAPCKAAFEDLTHLQQHRFAIDDTLPVWHLRLELCRRGIETKAGSLREFKGYPALIDVFRTAVAGPQMFWEPPFSGFWMLIKRRNEPHAGRVQLHPWYCGLRSGSPGGKVNGRNIAGTWNWLDGRLLNSGIRPALPE
jgi:hypothetical protein